MNDWSTFSKYDCYLPIFARCGSYESIFRYISSLDKAKWKGNAFEAFAKYFFLYDERVTHLVDKVWYWDDFPVYLKYFFKVPMADMGIDLVARTTEGKFWFIQAKFRSKYENMVPWKELATFEARSLMTRDLRPKLIERCILISTNYECPEHYLTHGCFSTFLYDDIVQSRNTLLFLQSRKDTLPPLGIISLPNTKTPRPYQKQIIDKAIEFFQQHQRGKIILPCGAGKTNTSVWIIKEYVDRIYDPFILIVLPRLDLVGQYMHTFLAEYPIWGYVPFAEEGSSTSPKPCEGELWKTFVIASDVDISDIRANDQGRYFEISLKETEWDSYFVRSGPKAVFVTLQSVPKFHLYLKKRGFSPDFTVVDEAHLTAGSKNKAIGPVLDPKSSSLTKILFLTATEKIIHVEEGDDKEEILQTVNCMSDPEIYGNSIANINFRQLFVIGLQEDGLSKYLVDYKIQLYLGVEEDYQPSRYVMTSTAEPGEKKNTLQSHLVALSMLSKAYGDKKVTHTLAYCNRVEDAKLLCRIAVDTRGLFPGVKVYFVHGGQKVSKRKRILKEYQEAKKALIFNAQLLRFGNDLPITNGIAFCSEVTSVIDIVQMIMRACRPYKDKKFFHILVPFICQHPEEFFENSKSFNIVRQVLTALSEVDFDMKEEWLAVLQGVWKSKYRQTSRLQIVSEKILEEDNLMKWLTFFEMACISGNTLRNFQWLKKFNLLKEYIQKYEKCPPKRTTHYCKEKIGRWVWDQRKLYSKGKLTEEKIHRLESLGSIWSWHNPPRELLKYEEMIVDKCHPYISKNDQTNIIRLKQDKYDICVQIIRKKRPDLMQLCVKPFNDGKNIRWRSPGNVRATKNSQPPEIVEIIEKEISTKKLFDGKIPPFFKQKCTREEWMAVKCEFKEQRIDCPSTMARDLYAAKGCHYIQIEGKGLYHLGTDLLKLGVPEFCCPQRFRVRIKSHGTKEGYMHLSVTVAIQLSNYKRIEPSCFTLDGNGIFPPL